MVRCFRCGRTGHYATTCYAHTHVRGHSLDDDDNDNDNDNDNDTDTDDAGSDCDDQWVCSYCARTFDTEQGARYHEQRWCQSRTRSRTKDVTSTITYTTSNARATTTRATTTERVLRGLCAGSATHRGVYVLVLDDGTRYVGKSENVPVRVQQHRGGQGSAWCARGGTTRMREDRPLTPAQTDLNSWEQNETVAQMLAHGCHNVRGWEFTSCQPLTTTDYAVFQRLVFASGNVCRKCGHPGHFAATCRSLGVAPWLQAARTASR